jgi:hypothetical protein
MANRAKQIISIVTLLCVLAHSLGACCAFAHAGCSHATAIEKIDACSTDCCRHGLPAQENGGQQQSPCQGHDHQNCEHCSGGCFQVVVMVVSGLDLIDDLPMMTFAFDAAAINQMVKACCCFVVADDDCRNFLRFDAPIFSQNQSFLI